MEITTQSHPLRTITLEFDRAKTAPDFETLALQSFQEMHDRTWEMKQRINNARLQILPFKIQVEELTAMLADAQGKFRHLEIAYDTNPYKPTFRVQLKRMLAEIHAFMDRFVPELVTLTKGYYDYDDYTFEEDKWRENIAYPQFNSIFEYYPGCSVNMVSFDIDLDDFKGTLNLVKQQEGKYYGEMNELIDGYSFLNNELEDFFEAIDKFDKSLWTED